MFYSFAVEIGHLDMVRWKWWLCLYFQHVTRYIGTDSDGRKETKKCKDQNRSIFLAKGALIRKSVFQIQRINDVHGRCSSFRCSSIIFHQILHVALGDELYNSVWALSGGVDMLPWPNVPSKRADGLGQVHCQYGTFAKLHTSCPCEVEFEVVLFFFEGDWYVYKIQQFENVLI